jgi:release factor glutamine methyltransferase
MAIATRLREAGCVFAEDEARLLISAADTPAELASMVERRVDGLPIEYVVGWAEFCGLRIAVDRGVFVPRHRSEFLVQQARSLVVPGAVVVDLCCGAGALGIAVASGSDVELHAVDIDVAAVKCARRNVEPVGGHVYEGDLYDALPDDLRGRVDMLVVNAPYVPTGAIETLPREAKLYEPPVALDGGVDGLDIQRRAAAGAAQWLSPQGHLLIETSEMQAARTAKIVSDGGLDARILRSEELDATIVVGGR